MDTRPPMLEDALQALRDVHERWSRKAAQADRAFVRLFTGEVSNGGAATRLSYETNYLSADLYSAESQVYSALTCLGLDGDHDIYDLAGIDRDARPSDY